MNKKFLVLLEISMSSLWLLSILTGISGAIWLFLAGGWKLVAFGLVFSIVMPWVYTIAVLPTFLIVPLIMKAAEKGMRLTTSILGFILSGYNNFILSIWVTFVFSWLVNQYTDYPLPAVLLWGYSVTVGPVGYMAAKEGSNPGPGTTMGVLFTQVAFLTLSINTAFAFGGHNPIIPLWLIILIFTSFAVWMGFVSIPKKVIEKKKKILWAEDSELLGNTMKDLLNTEFEVDLVQTGTEALEKAKATYYDLICTNIMLPQMNGITLIEHLESERVKYGKLVVMSDISAPEVVNRAIELGVDKYIYKEKTTLQDAHEEIHRLLSKK